MILSKKNGLTLVEILISVLIFSIAIVGLLTGQKFSKFRSQGNVIRHFAVEYAQSLLNAVMTYDYEDPSDFTGSTDPNAPSKAFNSHNTTFGAFDATTSGVYDDGFGESYTPLPEERIGLKYFRSTIQTGADAENSFELSDTLQPNITLLGPEDGDLHAESDPSKGFYKITQTQQEMNMFALAGKNQEKYFFMDDVDDFDGYRESIVFFQDIEITFEISVQGIYGNSTNFDYTVSNTDGSTEGTGTLTQDNYSVMPDISTSWLHTEIGALLTCDDTIAETQRIGHGYYSGALFKKISVKATWEYPIGSGQIKTLVIDGGKINPNNKVL